MFLEDNKNVSISKFLKKSKSNSLKQLIRLVTTGYLMYKSIDAMYMDSNWVKMIEKRFSGDI